MSYFLSLFSSAPSFKRVQHAGLSDERQTGIFRLRLIPAPFKNTSLWQRGESRKQVAVVCLCVCVRARMCGASGERGGTGETSRQETHVDRLSQLSPPHWLCLLYGPCNQHLSLGERRGFWSVITVSAQLIRAHCSILDRDVLQWRAWDRFYTGLPVQAAGGFEGEMRRDGIPPPQHLWYFCEV